MKLVAHQNGASRLRQLRAGFSLIELLIVLAVIMCIAAVSVPNMMAAVATLRCRLTMSSLSGFVQQCRTYGIKTNKVMSLQFTTVGGQTAAYMEEPVDGVAPSLSDAWEGKQFYLGKNVIQFASPSGDGAPPALSPSDLWGSSTAPLKTDGLAFNSRGLPCYVNTANSPQTCDVGPGFVFYFTYQPPFGQNGWSALSVSPAGRVKTWMAAGGKWMSN